MEHLLKIGLAGDIACVVTFAENWEPPIQEKCTQSGLPCYTWKDARLKLEEIFLAHKIQGAVAISWRHLLPLTLNKFLKYPLIIFHDSLLPKYRGFAPTPTAVMAGETEIGVTAFFAVKEVDAGDIILQTKMQISQDMYIGKIIDEQAKIYALMLERIVENMKLGSLISAPQNENFATYSIWRNEEDCLIDWKKSAADIYNFVRALGEPYPNAFTYFNEQKIYILKTAILEDKNFVLRDCGKIWSIKNNQPEIICGSGMIKILEARNTQGEIFLFNKLRCRLGANFQWR